MRDSRAIFGRGCFSNSPDCFMLNFQLASHVFSHASWGYQELDSLVSTLYLFQVSPALFWRDWFRAFSYGLPQCSPSVGALEHYSSAHSASPLAEKSDCVHAVN